jgi:hypothetical protein
VPLAHVEQKFVGNERLNACYNSAPACLYFVCNPALAHPDARAIVIRTVCHASKNRLAQ